MALLEIHALSKTYPDGWTMDEVSFDVHKGEIVELLGPSGCGKTTLLRLISGLELPEGGRVLVEGEDVTRVPPHRRGFGLMFQEYALFPHKDVFGNVAFGLRMEEMAREDIEQRVAEVLDLVGLSGFGHRDVNQLSGGERQRVALARSLAPHPRLLLLDEPLGALDRSLRERLMDELPRILDEAGVTTVSVTHDQVEAFAIADRVVLMREGHIVQIGEPEAVYRRPASVWAARFLGLQNLLAVKLTDEEGLVRSAVGRFEVEEWSPLGEWRPGEEARLLIRPEAARLADGVNTLTAEVTSSSFRGETYQLTVRCDGEGPFTFSLPADLELPGEGERVSLSLRPRSLTLLPGFRSGTEAKMSLGAQARPSREGKAIVRG